MSDRDKVMSDIRRGLMPPRIFVEVTREIIGGGGHIWCRGEISREVWLTARYPGDIARVAIDTVLAEADQYGRDKP